MAEFFKGSQAGSCGSFALWARPFLKIVVLGVGSLLAVSCLAPAFAHHAFDGEIPQVWWQGLLSGLAHPVIGLDHLAFIVAIGLISAGQNWRYGIPLGFVLAALGGTAIHMVGIDLWLTELGIASSVVIFGLLLVQARQVQGWLLLLFGSLAGLFHGYAYAEAIIGAGLMPLLSYLIGFTAIQYGIALLSVWVAETLGSRFPGLRRWAGWGITVVGSVFLTLAVVS
ncbi:MAG: HupE/UreJ family protein [Thermostichus sp. BF3_bins_97]